VNEKKGAKGSLATALVQLPLVTHHTLVAAMTSAAAALLSVGMNDEEMGYEALIGQVPRRALQPLSASPASVWPDSACARLPCASPS